MTLGALEVRACLHPSAAARGSLPVPGSSRGGGGGGAAANSPSNVRAKTSNTFSRPESAKLEVDNLSNGHRENVRSRRQALSGLLLCSTAFYLAHCHQGAQEALADEAEPKKEVAGGAGAGDGPVQEGQSVFEGLKSLFDPNETTKLGRKLPKGYLKSARGVVTKLRDSFNGDSKNESQFRRNADSAKEAIRDYVSNWRGAKDVTSEESYQALEKALRALGEFYSKQGPRAVLPEDVRARVLESLQTADDNL